MDSAPARANAWPMAWLRHEGKHLSLYQGHVANLTYLQGKIVDVLCEGIQLCCRAQGGHNAGHTIVKDGTTFDVHILRESLSLDP